MAVLIVVDNTDNWPFEIPGVEVVSSRAYLTDTRYSNRKGQVLINVCRSYGYQSLGYYVSLLAEARGHRAQPSVQTMQDFRSRSAVRLFSEDLGDLIEKSIGEVGSKEFEISIYFGKPLAKRHRRLAAALFEQFPAPLLRAYFTHGRRWQLQRVRPIGAKEVPESHRSSVIQAATEYFGRARWSPRRARKARAQLAILVRPDDPHPPSDEQALRRFERAASSIGIATERITKDDYGRLPQFDALFLREETYVDHYTYRFAQRAASLGMPVIDDPLSIIRCTNKVYLKELLERADVPMPRTLVVHRDNTDQVEAELGFPCVLKKPDSAFSVGVVKVEDRESLERELENLFEDSDLVIAQEFIRTEFDWRVGIFDRKALYVCRYYMAPGHWQILEHESGRLKGFGKVETLTVEEAPRRVVRTALRAASPIGDGLYGVDLKQCGRNIYVMEVNDNPNIDSDLEDARLGTLLYRVIMSGFLERIEKRRAGL
jgi:glutathione synthase/RimK-type ligase-like ATP-grasp enzyme